MEIRPIKTKADYRAALKEIGALMAAERRHFNLVHRHQPLDHRVNRLPYRAFANQGRGGRRGVAT